MHRALDGMILAILLAACGICISYYLRTQAEFMAAVSKNQAAAEKLNGATSEVERLEQDVQRLKTDTKAVEELARHRFGFVRADDVVIKIAQNEPQPVTSQQLKIVTLTPQARDGYTRASH